MQVVGALRRAPLTPKSIRHTYWHNNPKLRDDEVALGTLSHADALVGARGRLTLAEAQRILENPPLIPRALRFRPK